MQVITRSESNILLCPHVSFNIRLLLYANMFRLYTPTSDNLSCTSVKGCLFYRRITIIPQNKNHFTAVKIPLPAPPGEIWSLCSEVY
jgi:hypothetical protein